MEAGFISRERFSFGIDDISNATAPATTGDATEVPDSSLHSPEMDGPFTRLPYAKTFGLTRPYPLGSSQVVIPREAKGATLLSAVTAPTPITSGISAGLLRVPQRGPSFPMAETTIMLFAASSRTLSTKG
eukprot:253645_1